MIESFPYYIFNCMHMKNAETQTIVATLNRRTYGAFESAARGQEKNVDELLAMRLGDTVAACRNVLRQGGLDTEGRKEFLRVELLRQGIRSDLKLDVSGMAGKVYDFSLARELLIETSALAVGAGMTPSAIIQSIVEKEKEGTTVPAVSDSILVDQRLKLPLSLAEMLRVHAEELDIDSNQLIRKLIEREYLANRR